MSVQLVCTNFMYADGPYDVEKVSAAAVTTDYICKVY